VHAHDGRVALAGHVVERPDQKGVQRGTVRTLEMQGLARCQLHPAQPGILVIQRAQPTVVQRCQIVGMGIVAAEHHDAAVGRHIEVDIEAVAMGQLADLAAGQVDAC
jgi:hypothetical protein